MKTWKVPSLAKLDGETPEQMWACGPANLPFPGDTILDRNRVAWRVCIDGGYTLKQSVSGETHMYIRNKEAWVTLAGWLMKGKNDECPGCGRSGFKTS